MIQNAAGIHCILELYGCPFELLNDENMVRESIEKASRKAMSTLLSIQSHKFDPQGVTAIALLAESHISMHTWPELGYAAVDIFTCGETAKPQFACDMLAEEFKAGHHTMVAMPRGNPTHIAEYMNSARNDQREEQCLAQASSPISG